MAREVRHEATEPEILDADDLGNDGKLYVCRCGLSEDQPLCDGSHRRTHDEAPDTVYRYDPDGTEGDRCEVDAVVLAEE
jgi:CDGSH-type Zn-finger protein